MPLRLVGSLHHRALTDAAATTTRIETTLAETAPRRATAHQPAGGGIREAILQHWHERCYLATFTPSSACCSHYKPSPQPRPRKWRLLSQQGRRDD